MSVNNGSLWGGVVCFGMLLFQCSIFWIYSGNSFVFFLSVNHNNLVGSTVVSLNETFVSDVLFPICKWHLIPPAQDLETLFKYSYFHGNTIVCLSSIRIFLVIVHNWKLVIEPKPCLKCHTWEWWLFNQTQPDTFKELRGTLWS